MHNLDRPPCAGAGALLRGHVAADGRTGHGSRRWVRGWQMANKWPPPPVDAPSPASASRTSIIALILISPFPLTPSSRPLLRPSCPLLPDTSPPRTHTTPSHVQCTRRRPLRGHPPRTLHRTAPRAYTCSPFGTSTRAGTKPSRPLRARTPIPLRTGGAPRTRAHAS